MRTIDLNFLARRGIVALTTSVALAACGGGGDDTAGTSAQAATGTDATQTTGTDTTAAETAATNPAADGSANPNTETYGNPPADTTSAAGSDTTSPPANTAAAPDATTTATAAADPTVQATAVTTANTSVAGAVTAPHPTLENISLEWAFSGDANKNGVVNVRYRKAGTTAWSIGMPLRRVQGGTNKGFTWATRHSGSVFDLTPATTYDIELSLVDPDGGATVRTLQVATRAVPAPMAGAPIKAATPATFASVMSGAQPGDIIELGAGTYTSLNITKNGTAAKPLVIRRAASAAAGSVIYNGELSLISRQYVHVSGLTVNGRIRYNSSIGVAITRNTVNANASVGSGDGIVTWNVSQDAYIADNTVVGTSVWANSSLGVNGNNRGEGILVNGPGHVVMNNRVRGFRDNISLLEAENSLQQYSIDILNNELSEAADDGIEADYCHHNCRIMRNRMTNVFTGMSSQPGLGGPTYFIRNVAYNVAYVPFKLYNGSQGDVLLHNTIVKSGDAYSSYAGAVIGNLYGRNNLFIGGPGGTYGGYSNGSGAVIQLSDLDTTTSNINYDALGSTTGTFTGRVGGTRFTSLATLKSGTTEKNAVQVDLSVFATAISFPSAAMTQYPIPDLRLRAGAAAADVGQVIPNINDGYAGVAPDAGAYEVGKALPVYGPRP
ncbi:MAG: right-handed parallel beta-helix repeat-containing protein [Burkholderiales bacterium]